MKTLDVSILICTRDRSDLLEGCLRSVLACSPGAKEVVVVDQSRDESTRQTVCRHQGGPVPVRYLRGNGLGLSRGKNQGIADCTASIVAFTDDDCRVDPGWIGALTEPIRNSKSAAAVGRTLPERAVGEVEETFSVYAPEGRPAFSPRTHPWRVGGGGNFAATRDLLAVAGPFDERFGPGAPLESAEDMDMVHRLLRTGRRIVYVSEAVVWHRSWRSSTENRRLSRAYGIGAGGYFTKHLLAGDLLTGGRLLARLGVRSLHLARAALQRDRRRVAEQSVYLLGLFEGVGRYLSAGRQAPSPAHRLEREGA